MADHLAGVPSRHAVVVAFAAAIDVELEGPEIPVLVGLWDQLLDVDLGVLD